MRIVWVGINTSAGENLSLYVLFDGNQKGQPFFTAALVGE